MALFLGPSIRLVTVCGGGVSVYVCMCGGGGNNQIRCKREPTTFNTYLAVPKNIYMHLCIKTYRFDGTMSET